VVQRYVQSSHCPCVQSFRRLPKETSRRFGTGSPAFPIRRNGGCFDPRIALRIGDWYKPLVLNDAAIWKALRDSKHLVLIAGPCVIENEALCFEVARALQKLCNKLGIFYVFKASFDKANRTSGKSFRGPGLEAGLSVLWKIRAAFQVPVLTDVHTEAHVVEAAKTVDILQIPAFLCRQTDLINAAVKTGKVVNIKKGQFLSPAEMGQVLQKAAAVGGKKLLVTERGTTFGYNNLVADMRSLPIMAKFGFPVIFDATHSVQLPGGGGDKSAGQREFAPVLARCAIAAGVNGLFVETHPDPNRALSDGPNTVPLKDMGDLLQTLLRLKAALANSDC
jgi:2-dehydro-3-deoxyphosphooctonate aldolase (KDO 8-P synthase)